MDEIQEIILEQQLAKDGESVADDHNVMRELHKCDCKEYNGGQCYNCLNGAHKYCPACSKTENEKSLGLRIIIK